MDDEFKSRFQYIFFLSHIEKFQITIMMWPIRCDTKTNVEWYSVLFQGKVFDTWVRDYAIVNEHKSEGHKPSNSKSDCQKQLSMVVTGSQWETYEDNILQVDSENGYPSGFNSIATPLIVMDPDAAQGQIISIRQDTRIGLSLGIPTKPPPFPRMRILHTCQKFLGSYQL